MTDDYEIWGKVLSRYGYVLRDTATSAFWTHPQTSDIIVCPKVAQKPYIFHAAIDPSMDCFDDLTELDEHLKFELIKLVMLK